MRRPILALLVVAASLASISPAQARWSGWQPYQTHYLNTYVKCWHKLGPKCGRNIVDDGLRSGKVASRARVERSSSRMTGWIKPAPVVASVDSAGIAQPAPATTNVSSATSGCVPSGAATATIIQRESGGSPTAVNPSSGAYGCYQILGSTWSSACSDLGPEVGSSPAVQAQCAARLPSSAWAATGG